MTYSVLSSDLAAVAASSCHDCELLIRPPLSAPVALGLSRHWPTATPDRQTPDHVLTKSALKQYWDLAGCRRRLRDELLHAESFDTPSEAEVSVERRRRHYAVKPHSAVGCGRCDSRMGVMLQ